jgi:hypothetical protein
MSYLLQAVFFFMLLLKPFQAQNTNGSAIVVNNNGSADNGRQVDVKLTIVLQNEGVSKVLGKLKEIIYPSGSTSELFRNDIVPRFIIFFYIRVSIIEKIIIFYSSPCSATCPPPTGPLSTCICPR